MNTKELLKLVANAKKSKRDCNKILNEVAKILVVEFPNCGFDKTAIVEFIKILNQSEKFSFCKWFEKVCNNRISYSAKSDSYSIKLQEGFNSFQCDDVDAMPDFTNYQPKPKTKDDKPEKTRIQKLASFEKTCQKAREEFSVHEMIQASGITFTELERYYLKLKEVVDNMSTKNEE